MAMLEEAGEEAPGLDDLNTVQERALGRIVAEKLGTDFFFLDRFPAAVRPFYTMPCPDDARYSNSYDVCARPDLAAASRPPWIWSCARTDALRIRPCMLAGVPSWRGDLLGRAARTRSSAASGGHSVQRRALGSARRLHQLDASRHAATRRRWSRSRARGLPLPRIGQRAEGIDVPTRPEPLQPLNGALWYSRVPWKRPLSTRTWTWCAWPTLHMGGDERGTPRRPLRCGEGSGRRSATTRRTTGWYAISILEMVPFAAALLAASTGRCAAVQFVGQGRVGVWGTPDAASRPVGPGNWPGAVPGRVRSRK